jgi:hypothetical protein
MNALIRRIVLAGALAFLNGCTAMESIASAHSEWTFEGVAGLTLLLVDSTGSDQFEWLSFKRNGTAYAESGVSGPDFKEKLQWKLTAGGKLGIYSDTEIYDELTFISRTSKMIMVKRRTGEIIKYKILAEEHLTRRFS